MAQMHQLIHKLIQRLRRDGEKNRHAEIACLGGRTPLLASRHGNAISRLLIDQIQAAAPLHVT